MLFSPYMLPQGRGVRWHLPFRPVDLSLAFNQCCERQRGHIPPCVTSQMVDSKSKSPLSIYSVVKVQFIGMDGNYPIFRFALAQFSKKRLAFKRSFSICVSSGSFPFRNE